MWDERSDRMKTLEEILQKFDELEKNENRDPFGFIRQVLLGFLPFVTARPYLKESTTEEQWTAAASPLTEEAAKKSMSEYMEFAFEKAMDHRGLSASRSVRKMGAYLWLL